MTDTAPLQPTPRLKIKMGDFEFEGEGPNVQQMLADALKTYELTKGRTSSHEPQPTKDLAAGVPKGDNAGDPHTTVEKGLGTADADRLYEVTGEDGEEVVVLRALPDGATRAADALILILYGYKKLCSSDRVLGTKIMKSARHSGLPVDRVDRSIEVHKSLYLTAGERKSRTYMLNKQGENAAIKIIQSMNLA